MIVYRGRYADRGLHVLVIDLAEQQPPRYLLPAPFARLRARTPHGPPGTPGCTSFATGYRGAGPHCLAGSLLLDATGSADAAMEMYQDFAQTFLRAIVPGTGFEISAAEIQKWAAWRETERAGQPAI